MPPRFILIGNYGPDRQESMLRFTEMLADGLRARHLEVEIVAPPRRWAAAGARTDRGLAKWLAYVDKWILFPRQLRRFARQKTKTAGEVHFHICDHSNAPYLASLPPASTSITCHDVLAIRGALGCADAYCPASRAGVVLQKWILQHLQHAGRIACVSALTRQQLCSLAGLPAPKPGWVVAHNALNAQFAPKPESIARDILRRRGIVLDQPFLLNVGSNLPRKNRSMLIQMLQAGKVWEGKICFAGEPADENLLSLARDAGLAERVVSVAKPDHETLQALYSLADALVFPSFSEGFGWPVIEAQACGAPVIASSMEPMPEVGGEAALYADPHQPAQFSAALETLGISGKRETLKAAGFQNIKRFQLSDMIDKYLELHGISDPGPAPAP